jgi:hypothetical protein
MILDGLIILALLLLGLYVFYSLDHINDRLEKTESSLKDNKKKVVPIVKQK